MKRAQAPGLLTEEGAVQLAETVRSHGGKLVFTNGVFDLLHPGHVRYLREARVLGDALLVGLNSDSSVRAIKGSGRPIISEQERAEVMSALAFVDGVVMFDEETPYALIERLQPDILVKGADWALNEIIGRDIVESAGGKVLRIKFSPGFSTTALIKSICKDMKGS